MSVLRGLFGGKAGDDTPTSVQTIKDQSWQLGYKGMAPALYMDVSALSLQDTSKVVNALNEQGVEFGDRVRSTGARVIEAMGGNFTKLANIIGVDRVNELDADLNRDILKAAPWDFAFKNGTIPLLYLDSAALRGDLGLGNIEASLSQLDIHYSTRTRSSGSTNLEVTGLDMLKLNEIIKHPGPHTPVTGPSNGL